MYKKLCILIGCALLTGCGLVGGNPEEPVSAPSPNSPVVTFMIQSEPGASASLADTSFGGDVRVTLEETFLSAANEMCKRATVLSGGQEAEIVVICRPAYSVDDNAWMLAPRVWGNGGN